MTRLTHAKNATTVAAAAAAAAETRAVLPIAETE